jgi:DNA-binding PadR family transcriptional regulator
MNKKDSYELSHVAFVTLGLVAENPCHAKDIDERIEMRGMRNWTNIGTSSIYGVLRKLNEDGLVDSWIEELDNRMIKVYEITDYGLQVLKDKVFKVLKEYIGKNDEDFYVAFSMLPLLTQKQQIEALKNSLDNIKNHKKELEKMLEENANFPINVTGLFKHPIMILQTDIEFLEWLLKEIREGKSKIDPETYYK